MKWMPENWLIISAIYLGYTLVWYFGWQLSVNFETITSVTSWFLPAGIRVASLFLIDRKYWVVIALAEFTGIYAVNNIDNPVTSSLGIFIATFIPILAYMLSVHLYLTISRDVRFDSVKHLITFFSSIGIGSIVTAVILVTSLMNQGHIPPDKLITTIFSFIFGDLVGILLLVPLAFAIKSIYLKEQTAFFNAVFKWPSVSFSFISLVVSILTIQFSMAYFIKLVAFIPLIFFAYRNGWFGATVSIFVINILVVVATIFDVELGSMFEKQLYLIAISLTGLFLGAAISEQHSLNFLLKIQNKSLMEANLQLHELINKNTSLAKTVVSVQENERKLLSQELHDEIGQNITALKVNLRVISRMVGISAATPLLESTDSIADVAYQSVHDLMLWLRPRVIDDLGLEKALSGTDFERLLNDVGIQYVPLFEGDTLALNEDLKINIYRIVQESINNSVKYSRAKNFWMSLKIGPSNIDLEIIDDGIGFDTKNINTVKSSFGLQGIENRVLALGGYYSLTSSSEGTAHQIKLKH